MLAEPAIRRLLFGFLGFSIGEQAGWIAMLLVAAAIASFAGAIVSIGGSRQMPDAESSNDDEPLGTLQLLSEGIHQLQRKPVRCDSC